VSTVSTPDIQLLGNLIVVTGRLWNSGDEDAQGSMVLELLIDNRVLDTQTLPLFILAMMRRGIRPQINALAVLLILFSFLVASVGLYLRSRKRF
jgi:hypothetical protein